MDLYPSTLVRVKLLTIVQGLIKVLHNSSKNTTDDSESYWLSTRSKTEIKRLNIQMFTMKSRNFECKVFEGGSTVQWCSVQVDTSSELRLQIVEDPRCQQHLRNSMGDRPLFEVSSWIDLSNSTKTAKIVTKLHRLFYWNIFKRYAQRLVPWGVVRSSCTWPE